MKTIRNVHIAKQPFFIEDDAYILLDRYIEKIKTQFNIEDAQELTTDVELRIVELLNDRGINKGDVIPVEVVSEIIEQIGELNDSSQEEDRKEESSAKAESITTGKKKLFLDMKNGKIRGVCYGLGSYFGISPTIIRVIFMLPILIPFFNLITNGGTVAPYSFSAALPSMVFSTIIVGVILSAIYIVISNVVPYAQTEFDRAAMHGTPTSINEVFKAKNTLEVKEKSVTVISKIEDVFVGCARFASSSLRKISRVAEYILAIVFLCAAGVGIFSLVTVAFISDSSLKRDLPVSLSTSDRFVICCFIVLGILWTSSIALALISYLHKKTKLLTKIMIFCGVLILFSAAFIPFGIIKGAKYASAVKKVENTKISYSYPVDASENLQIQIGDYVGLELAQSKDANLNIVTTASKSLSKNERVKYDSSANKLVFASDDKLKNEVCTTCSKYQNVRVEVPLGKKVVEVKTNLPYGGTGNIDASSNFLNNRTLVSGAYWVNVDSSQVQDVIPDNQLLNLNIAGSMALTALTSTSRSLNVAHISSEDQLFSNCEGCSQNLDEMRTQSLMPEKANEIYIDAPNADNMCMLFPPMTEESSRGILYSLNPPTYKIIVNGVIFQGESIRPLMCKQ